MSLNILLVEDEPPIALLQRKALEEKGHHVETAQYGKTALEMLASNGVDFVVIDHKLPDISGADLLRNILEKYPNMPIVMVTGQGDERLAAEIIKAGALDYIVKDTGLAYLKELPKVVDQQYKNSRLQARARLLQQKLEASEIRFRATFEEGAIGIAILDLDRKISDTNRAMQETLGYTAEELIGKSLDDFAHGDDFLADRALYSELMAGVRNHYHVEKRYNRKSGEIVWGRLTMSIVHEKSGEPFYFIAMIADATKRKVAEEALKKSEQNMRAIIKSVGEGIIVVDSMSRICMVNEELLNIFGYAEYELIGTDIKKLMPDKYRHAHDTRMNEYLAGAPPKVIGLRVELEGMRKNGEEFPIELRIEETNEDSGRTFFTGAIRDISERKQAVAALQRRDAILDAVSFAAEKFLKSKTWGDDIKQALAHLGAAVNASRAYVFENHSGENGELLTSQLFEWVAPGITQNIAAHKFKDFHYRDNGFSRWMETLSKGKLIYGNVEEFPETEKDLLWAQDVRSIVVVPIFMGDSWWGLIGFDECKNEREWYHEELEVLKTAANTFGAAIERKKAEEELDFRHRLADADSRAQAIFIAGKESYEIFDQVLNILLSFTESEYGFIAEYLEEEGGKAHLQSLAITNIAWNEETQRLYEENRLSGLRFDNLDKLNGLPAKTGKPVISNDPANDSRSGGVPEGHPALSAYMGLPLYKGAVLIGSIGLANRPGGYDEHIYEKMRPLLNTCANIIEAVRIERQKKLAAEELESAKIRAEDATKLKDKFVSLVAHDLRSPFTSILGLIRLLGTDKEQPLSDKQNKIIQAALASGERMIKMINELLNLGRLQTGAIKPELAFLDGRELATTAIGGVSHQAMAKNIEIKNNVPENTRFYADKNLFIEVIGNLVSNAIKFCDEEGKIEIFMPDGMDSTIAVKDDGVGISREMLPNLFKHEVRTTTEGTAGESGTGLGLPYCFEIMEAHGGSLLVDSSEGNGAVFYAQLPYTVPGD